MISLVLIFVRRSYIVILSTYAGLTLRPFFSFLACTPATDDCLGKKEKRNADRELQGLRRRKRLSDYRQQDHFTTIGTVWEIRILAEVFDALQVQGMIVSDALAYIYDTLLYGGTLKYVRVLDDSDDGDVQLVDYLLDELRKACEDLARHIVINVNSSRPKINIYAAGHALRVARRNVRSGKAILDSALRYTKL